MTDPFVSCPYNSVHRVPRSRIQAHIVKCEPNYPPLAICPYNATHRMSQADLKKHVSSCPTKEENYSNNDAKQKGATIIPKPLLQRSYLPETDPNHEMWDD